MFLNIDYAKIIKAALAEGGEYADLYIENTRPTSIVVEGGKVEKVLTGVESGAGIRVIIGLRTVYAYTNDLTGKSLLDLAGKVARACGETGRDVTLDMRVLRPSVEFTIVEPPELVAVERKLALVKDADRAARAYDKRVSQVTVIYRDAMQDVTVACSDGTIAQDRRYYTVSAVNAVARDGANVQTGYESAGGNIGFELFSERPADDIGLQAAKRAVMMLTARKAPGGRMPVVISSEAGGTMVHEAVGHGLEADLAQNGLSVYAGKVGRQVGSPLVTVIDDPTIPGRRGSYRFDGEGTPARKTVLVEDGVLKGYMYDRLTAMKDGVVSTGNGRRESYTSRPIPRMTNTMIAPGTSNPAEVIRSCGKGLLVKKMGGGQVNTVNGDFVFEVGEGYLIEDGVVGEPVRGATLVGNGPNVLMGISMVGTDLGFAIGTCGKDGQGAPVSDAQPTLLIDDIVVGGSHE
ncbi:MAG: TldD/PmbA family protein [Nitrospirae bacterium]|nr:TldD/PmbA family protein [Nitrospirota bacterium]